jgi:2-haloacid dehalogenase
MSRRPAVVAFDVLETLASLEPLRARLTETGQPAGLLEAWYTRTLRDGMALSATGDYAEFTEVADAALRGLTHYTISDDQVAHVMAGFDELPAFPDALPAITQLNQAGLRVACLTNAPAALASSFVERAGLRVGRIISVGEVY